MKKRFLGLFILLVFLAVPVALAATADIKVNVINQEPDPAEPGSYVDLRLSVTNAGDRAVEDAQVRLVENDIIQVVDENPLYIGTLQARQTGSKQFVALFRILVDEDAVTGSLPIQVETKYERLDWVKEPDLSLNVRSNTPLINLEEILLSPDNVTPGSPTKLTFSLRNLAATGIKDVSVQVENSNNFVVKGSNTFFKRSIAAGKSSIAGFDVLVEPTTELGFYEIPININFTDVVGTTHQRRYGVGLTVYEEPTYVLNIENPEDILHNKRSKVTLSIANAGEGDINFFTVQVLESDQYDLLTKTPVYVGNLESDDFETAEFELTPRFFGDVEVDLLITYKDGLNQRWEDTQKITVQAFSAKNNQESPNFVMLYFSFSVLILITAFWVLMLMHVVSADREKSHKIAWFIIVFLTYVLGAIVYYFFGRKKTLGKT